MPGKPLQGVHGDGPGNFIPTDADLFNVLAYSDAYSTNIHINISAAQMYAVPFRLNPSSSVATLFVLRAHLTWYEPNCSIR